MNWEQIRELHPHSWVVVEALDGRTENSKRIIDTLSLLGVHGDDWKAAWEQYKELHRANRHREFYPIHTDREEMDIEVRDAFMRPVKNDEV